MFPVLHGHQDKEIADFAREGFFGPEIGDLLLTYGSGYKRSDGSLSFLHQARVGQGEKKMCYKNASELVLSDLSLTYVEGYAFSGNIPFPFPVAHAWAITESGLVLDPTWDSGLDYFGISMPTEKLSEYLLLGREYGILSSLWIKEDLRAAFSRDYPLL